MRATIIAGNWKENPCTLQEAKELATAVVEASKTAADDVEVVLIPPYPFIYPVVDIAKDTGKATVGGQNCFFEEKGAFTGSVAPEMVHSLGCEYVLCGHSERRSMFKNDPTRINRKVRAVLDHGMKPILCIGELEGEFKASLVKSVCSIQLARDLQGVTPEEMKRIVIAYEPVWAIGTGLTATPEIAQGVHSFIRSYLAKLYNQEIADNTVIQYGGSVSPETVDDLMACPDIDGALVGGASLDGSKFSRIINFERK
ncbi:unnamed protein product [Chrysoparadoxa australica]